MPSNYLNQCWNMLIRTLGTNFIEILSEIHIFSLNEMTRHHWFKCRVGGNPLPEPMMTQITASYMRHAASNVLHYASSYAIYQIIYAQGCCVYMWPRFCVCNFFQRTDMLPLYMFFRALHWHWSYCMTYPMYLNVTGKVTSMEAQ